MIVSIETLKLRGIQIYMGYMMKGCMEGGRGGGGRWMLGLRDLWSKLYRVSLVLPWNFVLLFSIPQTMHSRLVGGRERDFGSWSVQISAQWIELWLCLHVVNFLFFVAFGGFQRVGKNYVCINWNSVVDPLWDNSRAWPHLRGWSKLVRLQWYGGVH